MAQKRQLSGGRVFRGTVLFFNAVALAFLLASYGAYHISPATLPYIELAGLGYPYILLVNILFILFWGLTRARYAIIPLLLVAAGWNHIGRLVQFKGAETDQDSLLHTKVISFNLQNFLKLNTSTTRYVTDFENYRQIMDFLERQQADIVCMQEMLNDRENDKVFSQNVARKLNCPHYYYKNYFATTRDKQDAIAIFSRYPVIDRGHLTHQDKSIGIFCDLVREHDTLRVYNLHLASIHFKHEDYTFWSEITRQQEQDSLKAGTTKIYRKIHNASINRSTQVKMLAEHFDNSPFPVIVCGDFNDPPSSFAYNTLASGRKDAFVESGTGMGSTYAGELFPSFRIDFILHDNVFEARGFRRHKVPFSDHYPISTYLYRY